MVDPAAEPAAADPPAVAHAKELLYRRLKVRILAWHLS